MHALIIDDEGLVATVVEEFLRDCGFTSFDVASSAHFAIVAAALPRPDIIISDVQLKPGCGIANVETISQGLTIPAVFIARNAANITRRSLSSRVINKPLSKMDFIAAVASAMLEVSGDSTGKEHTKNVSKGSIARKF